VADEQDCAPGIGDIAHLAKAFALEIGITDGEHLVHHQDFWFQVGCDGKSQAQVHTRRVAFDGRVDELFNFRKSHDLIETGFDFLFVHAENGAVEEDILAPGQLGVETRANLQQRANASAQFAIAFSWIGDAREYLE